MKQLNIFCEGQTEQGFCVQVLQPHLFPDGDGIIHTLAVGAKNHHHLYGLGRRSKYETVRRFIRNTIHQRAGEQVYFTTLFDLYGLPGDFPGINTSIRDPLYPTPYVEALERDFGQSINWHRFIPYLQLHEYEALLFADPEAFAVSFENCAAEIQQLKEVVEQAGSPERINDGKDSAPSKRIISLIPGYDGRKTTAGPDIAEFIGIPVIRSKCPHFDQWLTKLENAFRESE